MFVTCLFLGIVWYAEVQAVIMKNLLFPELIVQSVTIVECLSSSISDISC